MIPTEHETPWYRCRRCGALQPGYLIFQTGYSTIRARRWLVFPPAPVQYWCLNHIPRWTRIKMWWKDR